MDNSTSWDYFWLSDRKPILGDTFAGIRAIEKCNSASCIENGKKCPIYDKCLWKERRIAKA